MDATPAVSVKQPSCFRKALNRIQPPFARIWRELTAFSSLAWRGAAIASVLIVIAYMAYYAHSFRTGLGSFWDVLLGGFLAALGIALAGLLVILLIVILKALNALPRLFTGALLGSYALYLIVGGFWRGRVEFAVRAGAVLVALAAILGGGLGVLLAKGARKAGTSHRLVAAVLLAGSVAVFVALAVWLAGPGFDPYVELQGPPSFANVQPLNADDPAGVGIYKVAMLHYGSGTNERRAEFASQADLKTNTVDASPLFKQLTQDSKGYKAWLRYWFWGFGPDQYPVNGTVWYPQGSGPFPLVLVVHGNHKMEEYSDPGYAYLGELLASRGFILVSVDENFLNSSWGSGFRGENGIRGWFLLQHLSVWRKWNETEGNPFYKKADFSKIALIGHSRGGEAVTHAAAFNRLSRYPDDANVRFNFGFNIKSLIAIAPVDGQYEPANQPAPLEDVNYLVLHGSHDSDVSSFAGARAYRRLRFTGDDYYFKAAIYAYRANHGQFNSVWGSYDSGPPMNRFINTGALLTGDEQRQIGKVYISAFLEATLNGRKEYISMFRDYRVASRWLPKTTYFSQFEDSNFTLVSSFDDGIDVTRTSVPGGVQRGENLSVWRLQEFKGRSDRPFLNKAVYLGWEKKGAPAQPSYIITLPDGKAKEWGLDQSASLVFSVADTDEKPKKDDGERDDKKPGDKKEKKEPVNFTVELAGTGGCVARISLDRIFPVQPALRVAHMKWGYLNRVSYRTPTEPVLQTYEIPLADFVRAAPEFDPADLKEIRFRFDGTKPRVIVLDQVGFAKSSRQ